MAGNDIDLTVFRVAYGVYRSGRNKFQLRQTIDELEWVFTGFGPYYSSHPIIAYQIYLLSLETPLYLRHLIGPSQDNQTGGNLKPVTDSTG